MSVAKAYARALYEAARDAHLPAAEVERMDAQLGDFAKLFASSKEMRAALTAPAIPAKEKAALLDQLARRLGAAPLVANLLGLLARKDRIALVGEVHDAFTEVRLEAEGGVLGTVVSADPMEQADLDGLAKAFTQKLGKRVAFRTETDPVLLAGMKVTVNGITYDGTLRSQLRRLRDRLVYGGDSA
jgi:F-type H+-transporting ATPase subunit delta